MFGRSTKILINGEVLPLTKELLGEIKEQNEYFSSRALRVLAFAYGPLEEKEALDFNVEHDLILVGLMTQEYAARGAILFDFGKRQDLP